ncbi:HBL/NHE enterotoxin family protein [Desulfitobacterium sp. AusDCA]|uniref:HBL/NHE enterotoxin family protein n=1 Tax=Desulfitobacterium sp. AusDCA TaxID=3240383 RepID=UPI003DA75804
MVDLTIDVEAKKDLLAKFTGDKLQVLGSVLSVGSVDLSKVFFEEDNLPGKDEILQSLKDHLALAQVDGQAWQNDIEPGLAGVAQAVINYGTLFANALPSIRKLMKNDTSENRQALQQIFAGLAGSVSQQIDALGLIMGSFNSFAAKMNQDAINFSKDNQNFSELEKSDEENLEEAKAAIDNLNDLIDQYNKDINQKIMQEEDCLTIADVAIAAGGDLGKAAEPLEALGLAIGLFFIISAGLTAQELSSEIDAAFQAAMEEAKYKVEITQLTEQLMCLNVTSSALQEAVSELGDIILTLQGIIDGWTSIGSTLKEAETELGDSSQPMDQIINEFNLGRASAEWEEAIAFAQKMEVLNIYFGKQKLVTPPPW